MNRLFLEASTSGRKETILLQRRELARHCGNSLRRKGTYVRLKAFVQDPKGLAGVISPAVQETVPLHGNTEDREDSSTIAGDGSLIDISQEGRQVTTFRWPAALIAEGQTVSVSGTFTGWADSIDLIPSSETGDWMRSIAVTSGIHEYKYKVDGIWRTSPCEPITTNSKGCYNNIRYVESSANFFWKAAWGGTEVYVTGDFTGWAPGTYAYQFLVYMGDKESPQWMTSPDCAVKEDHAGYICNELDVVPPPAFYIFYATGWPQPVIYVRWLGADGLPCNGQDWEEYPMYSTASRATPHGGSWKRAVLPIFDKQLPAPKVEFYVTNGADKGAGLKEDKPWGRDSYVCEHPGGYKLEQGRLMPFPQALSPPIMLVSDLDGTMVGGNQWANEATREFCNYWEYNAALCGGVLVYNTGRSLGQFMSLHEEKNGTLALPNALITAVGTKIFLLDNSGSDRSTASGGQWKEDMHWAHRLDKGWNLAEVKRVAGQIVDRLGSENACHWLDQGTEHPHRIALNVRYDKVAEVTKHLEKGFVTANLQVRIIVSGISDWRYIDCVPINGGKLEALEYVRMLFNIPQSRCVAAGDSGNDILMLEGENPAIIVGNAQPELLDWLVRQRQESRKVLTHAHMARGIMEGLGRLGLY